MFRLKKRDSESGIVLIIVLMATLAATLLATSYMSIVMHESGNAVWQRQRVQSLFLAEAGVQKGLYFLNNPEVPDNPWVQWEDNETQITPLEETIYYEDVTTPGRLVSTESYGISLHKSFNNPNGGVTVLPEGFYLVRSIGLIPRNYSKNIEHRISCIVAKFDAIDAPAALSIYDSPDAEPELSNFQSNVWTIDGRDHDIDGDLLPPGSGAAGIAISNDGVVDDLEGQCGKRLDQVTGWMNDEVKTHADAIVKDPSLPKNLDHYVNYFMSATINISGRGDIPESIRGTEDANYILFADLSKGGIKVAGNFVGYGVLVLYAPEGPDPVHEFEMAGNAQWNGLVICAGDGVVRLKGGGKTPAHINGAMMIANGFVEMNGTADITYSSEALAACDYSLHQIYSWCGGWGNAL